MTNRERMKLKRLKSKGEHFENEFVLEREGERERERERECCALHT